MVRCNFAAVIYGTVGDFFDLTVVADCEMCLIVKCKHISQTGFKVVVF